MNDRLLSLLGLCRRAGKLSLGFDAALGSARMGETELMITASDLSPKTAAAVAHVTEGEQIELLAIGKTMDEIGQAVGKRVGVLAVNDAGFAKGIRKLCRCDDKGGI
jgi:ribosomal protein L7Ae-like RNA K-turn-binding protein